jgi:luciferase family oxidoreductase group 1
VTPVSATAGRYPHLTGVGIPLSVLDLFPVSAGTPPTAAIRDSLALARRVEELGYARYWIAEHHNIPGIASAAPEVLIAHVASITRSIRVGAGGIMLPNHAPLHVLEVFKTLEALHPGRIDLGIGRAPGTDPVASSAVRRRSSNGGDVNEQIAELIAFARHAFPAGHPYAAIEAMPSDAPVPPIWMLGSTSAGASIAATLGVPFAFAGHFNMGEAMSAITRYRALFAPTPSTPEPRVMMAVSVVCGEDDAHAEDLAAPLRVAYARLATGHPGPFVSIDEARAYDFTPQERASIERFAEGAIIGGPERVSAGLARLADRTRADEIMVSTVIPVHRERVASYERVAKLWGFA